ncbi:type II secretion system F family protein [Cellulomonas sp. zg-ZUI222]|uniref:Type II secretion system F family protein n=1 Tax=Cellulomonas wangleii TaxID=2816956 RepID=A0ABX8D3Z7_9CELL|nr:MULTISPECIES: type II secretion system F family protein [Cellulomonas]MBO0898834.1 type II secretion system F family protein [Cellulomonas sp. zg-ZUI22]MBO0919696.1 type II secretion system F family protein [Cellulomonas wangleii]MBO0923877.1 type II secretion system F family protein [Cellulomonas wangleii]MBO0924159.1 type II secretion system F family protein [Cellulomonas wangleii]QVI62181.1 type II secretion system F family protein [Cellulomonas wangleii]
MTGVLVAGALAGLGVLVLVLVLVPPATRPAGALARLDRERREGRARARVLQTDRQAALLPSWEQVLGRRTAGGLDALGIGLGSLRSDLSMVGLTRDAFLARTVLAGLAGLVVPLLVTAALAALGTGVPLGVPVVVAVVVALVAGALPALSVRSQAARRRRDFRHVVGSFLDLVAMSLAGGRGVPEALSGASEISDGWAMVRIRDALIAARLRGETPWAALGALGEDLRVDELRDLAAALALVAEDGAKVRDSLAARAGSMRRRELADAEGKAGESSETMLVAQLLLAIGFLVFLVYPAAMTVFGSG